MKKNQKTNKNQKTKKNQRTKKNPKTIRMKVNKIKSIQILIEIKTRILMKAIMKI